VEDDDWDVLFSYDVERTLAQVPLPPRRRRRIVNHCGYYMAAGQKCLFAKHVQAVERAHGRNEPSQRRHLLSFVLSEKEQAEAWRRVARADPAGIWVVKGCTGSGAEDVHLVRSSDEAAINAAMGSSAVAQEYVRRPLKVLGGGKWNVRVYVLVTSWAPSRAFYLGGVVLMKKGSHDASTASDSELFSRTSEEVEAVHIDMVWNAVGLQRAAEAKEKLKGVLAELFGGATLSESFGDFGSFAGNRSFDCFDLFGLDVMLGEDLAPYVLEVNQGPDLWGKFPLLWAVKGPLVLQIARWAGQRARHPGPLLAEEEEAVENSTLSTFTRFL